MLERFLAAFGRGLLFAMSLILLGCDSQIAAFIGNPSRITPDDRNFNPTAPSSPSSPSTPVYTKPTLVTEMGGAPNASIIPGNGFNAAVKLGNKLIFAASDTTYGNELWSMDLTTQNFTMVSDLLSGVSSSNPTSMIVSQGLVYFFALDFAGMKQLWSTDGTSSGTLQLTNLASGVGGLATMTPTTFGVFIYVVNGANLNLWRSNGTPAGTSLLQPINASTQASMVLISGYYYFVAGPGTTGGTSGSELWRSDGSVSGTTLVYDLEPGTGSSNPRQLSVLGTKLLFQASTSANGSEVFVHDTVASTTTLLKEINTGSTSSAPVGLRVEGSYAYFIAIDPAGFYQIWKSDGTTAGTTKVGADYFGGGADPFIRFGNYLFYLGYNSTFSAFYLSAFNLTNDMATPLVSTVAGEVASGISVAGFAYIPVATTGDGMEMRKINLTNLNTVTVKDINPSANAATGVKLGTSKVLNSTQFIFQADDGTNGLEWWVSDGTSGGTTLLKDITAGSGSTAFGISFADSANSVIYFEAAPSSSNSKMWVTDGTTVNTKIVTSSPRTYANNSSTDFRNIVGVINDKIIMNGGTNGKYTLSFYNPTSGVLTTSTTVTADYNVYGLSHLNKFFEFNQKIFFDINSSTTSYISQQLAVTDGTTAGTAAFYDSNPTDAGATVYPVRFLGSSPTQFFFAAYDSANGFEIWASDGTPGNTSLLKDISVGASGTQFIDYPSFGAYLNSKFIFSASTGAAGSEIWTSDGTTVGTTQLLDLNAGANSGVSITSPAVVAGGNYFFVGNNGSIGGSELFKTDGTVGGTGLVKDVYAGATTSGIQNLIAFGNSVIFTANDGTNGTELWISDGTSGGTFMLKDIAAGAASIGISTYAIFGTGAARRAVFFLSDGVTGNEPWITDGTTAGTKLLKDINPGSAASTSGATYTPVAIGNTLYFWANDGVNGVELWKTDGTEAGTVLHSEISPGKKTFSFTNLKYVNGKIYFTSTESAFGTSELFSIDP